VIAWQAVGATHTGRRRRGNEDAHHLDPQRGIFLVADGMGGHAAGEIASGVAAATVSASLAAAADRGTTGAEWEDALRDAVREAHAEITRCCATDTRTAGMGTTLTVCVIDPAGVCRLGHIGDSRAYLLRDRTLRQLTRDHTWVQRELEAGHILAQDAPTHPLNHILTRVLTADLSPEIDLLTLPIHPGDLVFLASDGLYNMLPDPGILAILAAETPLATRAASLLTAANRAGGADNITVVLISIEESPDPLVVP
jgi:protein phosphatase